MTKWAVLEVHLQEPTVVAMKASLQDFWSSCMLLYCFPKEGPLTSVLQYFLFLEETEANTEGLSVNHLLGYIIAHAVGNRQVDSLVCIGLEMELVSQYVR